MAKIDVDFDVFKELTIRRTSEEMTENDVIRDLLGLEQSVKNNAPKSDSLNPPWRTKGVTFPHNTKFRANYKGRLYNGIVENGSLLVNGKRFTSASAAAMFITENSVNGWIFWECLLPSASKWKLLADMRH